MSPWIESLINFSRFSSPVQTAPSSSPGPINSKLILVYVRARSRQYILSAVQASTGISRTICSMIFTTSSVASLQFTTAFPSFPYSITASHLPPVVSSEALVIPFGFSGNTRSIVYIYYIDYHILHIDMISRATL